MEYQQNRTWMEVSLDNLTHNFRLLSDMAGPTCPLMGILKCNASGLGAPFIAKELEAAGCTFFGVATVEEGMELRDCGITTPLLIFGAIDFSHVPVCAQNKLTLSVFGHAYASALSEAASHCDAAIDVHLKVDTGLARYGIALDKDMEGAVMQAKQIATLPGLALKGVYSHAANAGEPVDDEYTLRQFSLFCEFTSRLAESGLRLVRHFANSPTLMRFPQMRLDMVRSAAVMNGFNILRPEVPLREVASLKTRIISIRELSPGDTLSYSRLYTAQRKTRIGVIPLGYGDGMPRCVGNRAFFLTWGKKVPLIGKLCMDVSFIDITDVPEASIGDIVTVFGQDGEAFQSVFAIANLLPGAAPEVTTVLGRRIPRFYLRNGKIVGRDTHTYSHRAF